jgi:Concanavalin A-like lectin/glucanases superfamily
MGWHHVAATYASGKVQAYLDGAPQMSNTVPLTSHSADELLIGCDVDVGAPFGLWTGQLDDVRYFSRALAPSEIAALAE